MVEYGDFIEIYCDSPIEICEQRDVKGIKKHVPDRYRNLPVSLRLMKCLITLIWPLKLQITLLKKVSVKSFNISRFIANCRKAFDSKMSSSIILFTMKIGNAGLAFLLNLLVARLVGVDGFGVYSISMALIAIFSVVSTLGLESLSIKDVAVAVGRDDNKKIDEINNASISVVVLVAISITFVLSLIYSVTHYLGGDKNITAWVIAAVALTLPLATINRHISFLQMAKGDVFSQLPLMIITPLVTILLILAGYYSLGAITVEWILSFFVFSNLLVLTVYLYRGKYSWAVTKWRDIVQWFGKAKYFFMLNIAQIVTANIGLVMLGLMANTKETGIFSAATKVSSIVLFLLYSTNMTLMPTIADCYHNNKHEALQKKLIEMNRLSFVVSVFMLGMIFLFGLEVLNLFGHEFEASFQPLLILVAGMVLCAVANAAGPLLSMTGHVKKVALLCVWMTVFSVVANYLLIPSLKSTGAAIATSLTLVLQNLIAVVMIYRYVGVNPTLFGRVSN